MFDLYGTLVDVRTDEAAPRFRRGFSRYFKKMTDSEEDIWALLAGFFEDRGEEEPDILIHLVSILTRLGVSNAEEKAVRLARYFRKNSTEKLRLYDGVMDMLQDLKRAGAKMYVLSNAQSAFTLDEMRELNIYELFDGVELSSDFGFKKPSRLFFDHLLEKYGLRAEDCVYFGNDICADIIPAKALGMQTVYILTDISPAKDSISDASQYADFVSDNDFQKLGQIAKALL